MAFCTQCGTQVGDGDVFCARCGAHQRGAQAGSGAAAPGFVPPAGASFAPPPPGAGPLPRPHKEFLAGQSDNHVAGLCYIPVVGWIFSIIVLAGQRFRHSRDVRFHAFQGLYVFVVWLIMDWVFSPIVAHSHVTKGLVDLLELGLIVLGVFLLIKTRHGEMVRLPFLGELAEKSVAEQK